jgi:hypothetical protein
MKISIFFVLCALSFLGVRVDVATATECNGSEGLHIALLEHDKARIEFRYKMQTGYIRRAGRGDITIASERNRFLYGGPRRTLDAIQAHLKALDPRATTYALVYDPRGTTECVWLVGPDGLFEATRSLGPNGQKFSMASALRDVLRVDVRVTSRLPVRHDSEAAPPRVMTSLAPADATAVRQGVIPDAIMRKIQESARTLLVLPIGDLSAVPFAALPGLEEGKFLIDFSTTIVLPSVDGLFFWVAVSGFRDFRNALIVGDPDLSGDPEYEFPRLSGAKAEAENVARFVGGAALVGQSATHEQVLEKLRRRPQLIYLATHGVADAVNPMDGSFLALGGKHLFASEIKQLRYPEGPRHPFVVMSACETGLGKTFNAGIFGLARAWIYAGAAQVLASQWNVDDEATAHLMTAFMKKMQEGADSQQAFRQAILVARSKYPDPALWGSFNLIGYPQPQM